MWIKIKDKEIEREVKRLIRGLLKDMITYKWIREVIEAETEKIIKQRIRKMSFLK